ncbi:ribosome assembly cofactor RimP [Ascidiimonas aurantiaca]|uniref:ribosome assembly cofactor RimP n=1 Tax=Ascidiimonas aurantiaca TaxID=1685432 RepID=UPI003BB753E1
MLKEKVVKLLHEALAENESLFLISLTITPDNKIHVVIDGDQGVTLNDCVTVSRAIEHQLDRDETDFSLEVMSPGAFEPIVNPRQYIKNIGRTLEIEMIDGQKAEGKLDKVGEDTIVISWKEREPKPLGKGKITVKKEKEILFPDIVKAKVKIKF